LDYLRIVNHSALKNHEVLTIPLRAPSRLCDFVVKQQDLELAHARENGHEDTKVHEELKKVMHFGESTLSVSLKTTQMRRLSKHLRDMYKF